MWYIIIIKYVVCFFKQKHKCDKDLTAGINLLIGLQKQKAFLNNNKKKQMYFVTQSQKKLI
jgi:hypothetical protein